MYIWESNRKSTSLVEENFLKSNTIQKLYIKFFEIEKSVLMGIHPTAKSKFTVPMSLSQMEVIPVVYIRNEVFKQVNKKELDEFAENMIFLIKKRHHEYFERSGYPLQEMQMDCDWTISTQENYFYFLRKLKAKTKLKISATLRLYPYKFLRNSILDVTELEKYLKGAENYPIPLDLALPTYSNALLYQNDHFVGLHALNNMDLKRNLKVKKGNLHIVKKDTLVDEIFLREGDQVKLEIVDKELVKKALKIINQNVCFDDGATVSLFHLTSSQLNYFNHAEINSFYGPLSR